MLHPILRTLVKVAVASLVVGTILAHFGITAEQLMREFGLSADRLEDYARKGFAWAWPNVLLGSLVIVQARLIGFDRGLEEAAMDLGCPPLRTFLTVTLPLIAPALAAGWVLAFMLSLDDLVIASFTTGPGATTLPIRIYSEVRLGVKPEINAICTIMIAIVAASTVASSLMAKRGALRRERAALDAQV